MNSAEVMEVNLDDYLKHNIKALIGRQNGKDLFRNIKNQGIDLSNNQYERILIIIPERIITMNNSFFQGFLENSVKSCGGDNKFLEIYEFKTSHHILERIKKYAKPVMSVLTP